MKRAFGAGFGVETDVRDHEGELVIAHDIPRGKGLTPFADVVRLFASHDCPGALAINIKADGLHAPIGEIIESSGATNVFVFDMAVPDALQYLNHGFCTFTRHSEIEPVPAFYGQSNGVWIDCFSDDWITPQVIRKHREADKLVALVSPELHGRPYQETWRHWRTEADDAGVMLCTDFPHLARAAFQT